MCCYFELLILFTLICFKGGLCYDLLVTSTSPAVMNTPIKFTATIDVDYSELRYFVFEDQTPQPQYREIETSNKVASATFIYNFNYISEQSPYVMNVRVYNSIFGEKGFLIAEGSCLFYLTANIKGDIQLAQNGTPASVLEKSMVATNKTVNMTANIWDPLHYFKSASLFYTWTINDESTKNISLLSYNFTTAQVYNISVVIEANVTVSGVLHRFSGLIQRSVTAKAPIDNLQINGEKVFHRDNDLSLTVTYKGSPGFWYCFSIDRDTGNSTKNTSCDEFHIYRTFEQHFEITRYLQNNGSYILFMSIGNDVSTVTKKIEITILGINNQPQLSFVIIPVASCIAAIFIIIAGIAYHLKHKPNYTIEVADFDFQHQDDLVEKSLFERVRESFTASIKGDLLNACRRGSNYGSYYSDDDVTPETRRAESQENRESS